ncbi:unnamed protein product [Effrenium voratum]|nr:unnamed protein product [Effrenium voratum]
MLPDKAMDKVLSAAEAASCAGRSCRPQARRLRYPDNKHLSKKVAHTFLNLGKVKAVLTVPVEKLSLQMDESTHVLMVALLEASLHSQVRGTSRMSPISAVILFNDAYEVGEVCSQVNAAYCQKHGYRLRTLVLSNPEMEALCEGRHFAWGKVALLRWMLGKLCGSPVVSPLLESKIGEEECRELLSAEWLVWFDADLMVLNHGWPLTAFLDCAKDLVLGEDMADLDWLNTGLMMCRIGSTWMQGLWDKVWHEGDAAFHQGEFWDQSALCGCLAKWGEFSPDVIGGKRVAAASAQPWFSWQGGARVRETQHLRVLDAGGTQTNNPRYARFAFHAAGMKDKARCCRHLLELRAGVHAHGYPDEVPWQWPRPERRTWAAERPVRWQDPTAALGFPALGPANGTCAALGLAALADSPLGDRQVDLFDLLPREALAASPPPAKRPFGRGRARLWEAARYAAGVPPASHGVLREMDPQRLWHAVWRPRIRSSRKFWRPSEHVAHLPGSRRRGRS